MGYLRSGFVRKWAFWLLFYINCVTPCTVLGLSRVLTSINVLNSLCPLTLDFPVSLTIQNIPLKKIFQVVEFFFNQQKTDQDDDHLQVGVFVRPVSGTCTLEGGAFATVASCPWSSQKTQSPGGKKHLNSYRQELWWRWTKYPRRVPDKRRLDWVWRIGRDWSKNKTRKCTLVRRDSWCKAL